MFDSLIKKKAIMAKDTVIESVKEDIQNSPGIGTGIVAVAGVILTMVLSALLTGKTPNTSQQSIINNIYITKEDLIK